MDMTESQVLIVVLNKGLSTAQICQRIEQIKVLHGVDVVRSLETVKEAVLGVRGMNLEREQETTK